MDRNFLLFQHRYDHLVPDFNASVWDFWNKYFANDKAVTDVLYGLSDLRGKENNEQQGEIEGLAAASKLPLKFVQVWFICRFFFFFLKKSLWKCGNVALPKYLNVEM